MSCVGCHFNSFTLTFFKHILSRSFVIRQGWHSYDAQYISLLGLLFSISVCIVVIDRMMSEYLIVKDMEGSCHGLVEIISWHLCGGTEKNHRRSQSGQSEPRQCGDVGIVVWSCKFTSRHAEQSGFSSGVTLYQHRANYYCHHHHHHHHPYSWTYAYKACPTNTQPTIYFSIPLWDNPHFFCTWVGNIMLTLVIYFFGFISTHSFSSVPDK
jgi:hypothetical protein